jgi:hypothetical protein
VANAPATAERENVQIILLDNKIHHLRQPFKGYKHNEFE